MQSLSNFREGGEKEDRKRTPPLRKRENLTKTCMPMSGKKEEKTRSREALGAPPSSRPEGKVGREEGDGGLGSRRIEGGLKDIYL